MATYSDIDFSWDVEETIVGREKLGDYVRVDASGSTTVSLSAQTVRWTSTGPHFADPAYQYVRSDTAPLGSLASGWDGAAPNDGFEYFNNPANLNPFGQYTITLSAYGNPGVTDDSVAKTINISGLAILDPSDVFSSSTGAPSEAIASDSVTFTALCSSYAGVDKTSIVKWYLKEGWDSGESSFSVTPEGTGSPFTSSFDSNGQYQVKAEATINNGSGDVKYYEIVNFQIGATPTISITSPSDGSTVYLGKLFQVTATNASTDDISSSVIWKTDSVPSIATGNLVNLSSLGTGTHTISASVTDSSQTVEDSITVTLADLSTESATLCGNSIYKLISEKQTGYVLYNSNWNLLYDDDTGVSRGGFSEALGGGVLDPGQVVLGDIDDKSIRIGSVSDSEPSLVPSLSDGNISLSAAYAWYRDYIHKSIATGTYTDTGSTQILQGGDSSAVTTTTFTSAADQTPISMSEFNKTVMSAFCIRVKNDTSGTDYDDDGNGHVQVTTNMGTGSHNIAIAANAKSGGETLFTGVANNTPQQKSGIEGNQTVNGSISAMSGGIATAISNFTVHVPRGSSQSYIVYQGTTYNTPNPSGATSSGPVFFFTGPEHPDRSYLSRYG